MRSWQDEFSHDVAMSHGMTRIGPGRRRLRRAAWRAEQQQAEFFADAAAQHAAIRRRALRDARKEGEKEIQRMKEEAAQLGNRVGEVAKSILGAFHTPTKKALEAVEKAEREKTEISQKAKLAQKSLEDRLKNRAKQVADELRADLEKQKRITESYEEDLKRLLPKAEFERLKREKSLTLK